MNLFASHAWLGGLVSGDQFHRLGQVVLHSLWQATAIAAVLAVALRILPRRTAAAMQARYAMATLALVALPVACGVTYGVVGPPRPPAAAAADAGQTDASARSGGTAVAIPHTRGAWGRTRLDSQAAGVGHLIHTVAQVTEPWLTWCGSLWLVGAVAAAMRLAIGVSAARRLVATAAAPTDARWQARLDRWQHALGIPGHIRLVVSGRIDVPMVIGWLEPVVIWPLSAITGMPPDHVDAILAHELAHIRRHDVVVNLVQCCIETLFFHHPAAWWISAQVRAEREHCADDLAIRTLNHRRAGDRFSYASALVALEERRQLAALAVAADGGSLTRRIQRLMGIEPVAGHPARLAAAVLVLLVVGATAATLPAADRGDAEVGAAVATAAPAPATAPAGATTTADTTLDADATAEANAEAPVDTDGKRPALAPVVAPAVEPDGLPQDTNTIRSLTPEQAGQLAGRNQAALLLLDGLTELDVATAEVLVEHGRFRLTLNGLREITTDVAAVLARFRGRDLSVSGLKTISAEAAAAIGEYKGFNLRLDGLQSLDADAARGIARFTGPHLSLNGLTRLDAAAATELAAFKGDSLFLAGLKTLPADAAGKLAAFQGGQLDLNGLTTISAAAAEALAAFKGQYLQLDGLTRLDRETAQALATFSGRYLHLRNLTEFDTDTLRALAASKSWNGSLDRLTTLSVDAAEALAEGQTRSLALGGLTEISPEAAAALGRYRGWHLSLNGLTSLTAATARGIAAFGRSDSTLHVRGLRMISADAAREIAEFRGADLELPGITTLDADAAAALARFQGKVLDLGGVATLDAEAAAAVAEFNGDRLHLVRLTAGSPAVVEAVTRFQGALWLNSFWNEVGRDVPLTLEMAQAISGFAARHRSPVSLPGVTAFEAPDAVEIATVLASTTGPLALPNLVKISPKTLSALITKEDVHLPLIETLELIREPDGGATDDFVIPEGFEARQRRQRRERGA